ncbi:Acetophenone carboxylase gamma subunit [Poriferisphaera corsica]|uniref:Acetophenone carboxylase gamma subunit n=1 Tax=Poriferisphaera corsica TaxID=2528020 RepID=A0A517YVD4_9BACT|nr:hydantoinase/oxoprolinase family protein [Poriferisphaera corsica]QDU34198.1 Acetophenone carboxylase gamma subunit [Poriferisphaera corsica]
MRIGVDTGGTFTDIVLMSDDGLIIQTHKRLSTPDDPSLAVIQGITELFSKINKAQPSDITVIHGSTVATNALLELRNIDNPPTAMIFTEGFTDTLAIARQTRPDLYAINPKRSNPPIPRSHCIAAPERLNFNGEIISPLSEQACKTMIDKLRDMQIQSVAICLLHSYANSIHEKLIAQAIANVLPNVHLTVSSELLPEYREYERASTCAINAVVAPTMNRYIKRLEEHFGSEQLRIMCSHGGILPAKAVRHHPVRTVLSGPAGGVQGAIHAGQLAGLNNLITFDMGGTSTDVSLIQDGKYKLSTEQTAAGLPVHLPMIDIHTVGAGGGSIAWIDKGGALRVGPRSAGADPGPASYGKQPTNNLTPTVTDAHILLGHIPEGTTLGNDITLNPSLAEKAISQIASKLSLTPHQTAEGILRIAEITMAKAVGQITLQQGHDPREYSLITFGGAGGFHACSLADQLGIKTVLLPPHPGLLSAVGMLSAKPIHHFSHTILQTIRTDDHGNYPDLLQHSRITNELTTLITQAHNALESENIPVKSHNIRPQIDLRYQGQSYEITVSLDTTDPIQAFELEHKRLYGYLAHSRPIEAVTLRVTATTSAPYTHQPTPLKQQLPDQPRTTPVIELGKPVCYTLLHREKLNANDVLPPHTILSEYSSTTVIPETWHGVVTDTGHIIIRKEDHS